MLSGLTVIHFRCLIPFRGVSVWRYLSSWYLKYLYGLSTFLFVRSFHCFRPLGVVSCVGTCANDGNVNASNKAAINNFFIDFNFKCLT